MRPPIRFALATIVVGVAGVFGAVWLGGGPGPRPPVGSNAPERETAPGWHDAVSRDGPGAVAEAPGPLDTDPRQRARGPRPGSLADTDVDGGLRVDESGRFVPDPDALALFNYFLSATGEEDDALIRQRIRDEIALRLDPPADAEAAALLDRVLAFREAMRELTLEGVAPVDLERRLQWIRELRRAHFGADSEALFGEEENVVAIDLERRRVFTDPALDERERAEQLASLDEQLPPRVREARARARAPARVREEVVRLAAEGADPAEIFAVRESAFGAEAAARLAALDAERAAWEARLDTYRAERVALLDELGIDQRASVREVELVAAVRARLDALRAARFDEREQLRVRALDGTR